MPTVLAIEALQAMAAEGKRNSMTADAPAGKDATRASSAGKAKGAGTAPTDDSAKRKESKAASGATQKVAGAGSSTGKKRL